MMEFNLDIWRERAAVKVGEAGQRLKTHARLDLPYIAYGTVAGLGIWPLVEQAVTTGQVAPVIGALYAATANVGLNLIANRIEAWKDRAAPPDEDEVIEWAAQEAGNAGLREALDDILEKLDAIPAALSAPDEADQVDLQQALVGELARLGNLPRFQTVITGGGAFVAGDVNVEGDFINGDQNISGDKIMPGGVKNVFQAGDETGPDRNELRRAYLHHVWETTAYLSLGGVDPRVAADAETRLDLAAVYTALLTEGEREFDKMAGQSLPHLTGRDRRQRSAVEELDRHKHLVLLGEPGSGKSTLAAFVALCLSGATLDHPVTNLALLTAPVPDDDGNDEKETQPWHHGPLLPVMVVLRDLASTGLPPVGQAAGAEDLWAFLEQRLARESLGEFVPYLRRELREKGGLVILDGLDEVPEADRRRVQIKQIVESFKSAFPRCRILVTSRTYAYQNQDWKLTGFTESVLAPFSAGQIRRFVDRWYGYIGRLRHLTAEDSLGRAQLLKAAIFGSDRLMGLAERPLLLTLMASLHAWRGGTLPQKREELYHDAVDLLLDWWENQRMTRDARGNIVNIQPSLAEWLKIDRDRVRELLNELAYEAHAAQPDLVGTADISEERLIGGLMALTDNPEVKPKLLVQYLSHRAGLLVPRGVGVYTFPHRTFQEYLAACYLTDHDYPDLPAQLVCEDLNRWREVVLLAAAKAARGSKPTVWLLIDALCIRDPEDGAAKSDASGALLAGQVLLETADLSRPSEANRRKIELVRRWQKTLLTHSRLPDVDRALAGRSLADLGDDRPEVMDVDAMQFCFVPGGDFWMGEDIKGEPNSLHPNQHLQTGYWLGRYPVTNAQFEPFIQDKGYEQAEFWQEAITVGRWADGKIRDWQSTRSRPYDFGRPFTFPNHPVVGITWYEALAFTRWLTERWRERKLLPAEWTVKLPSEAEWEKGARGGVAVPAVPVVRSIGALDGGDSPAMIANPDPDRRHPWIESAGPRLANTSESAINATNAAGLFPLGQSAYGCEEMAGTVWEWTRSLWGKDWSKPSNGYPYDPEDGRENLAAGDMVARVIRGGSYYNNLDAGRCALRFRDAPDLRFDSYGCRVLVAPS
jgi:formylglycine-generating enzyme required for sulfatase activity/predicted ATPase